MTARDQLKDGWTVVLRRQPARIVDGQAESPLPDHRRHSAYEDHLKPHDQANTRMSGQTMTGYR